MDADTRLHRAVRYGNVNATLGALQEGLSPNTMGLFKWSPVHEAANNGERDILRLLISYNGDVNLADKLLGNTPLHYAAREDNSACVTVLLKAGARTDIKNYQGLTCLDDATALCREMIEEFVNSRNVGTDWKAAREVPFSQSKAANDGDWTHGEDDRAAIGQLHLSFEHHKTSLKIRVWEISEILLPPPQISMIDSIFVTSRLVPDPAKKSLRQTEAVKADTQSKESAVSPNKGIQHILSPSTFKFETPLLYTGISQEIITERSIHLEVYMTQKHTRKTFLMSMFHIPLRIAVRHPIRDKYPLIPCVNHTIPNNMRVYSARDIMFDHSASFDRSISRSDSGHSGFSLPSTTTRDMILDHLEYKGKHPGSQELSDSDCDDGGGSNFDAKSNLGKSRTSSMGTIDIMSLTTDNEDSGVYHRETTRPKLEFHYNIGEGEVKREERPQGKKKIIPNELAITALETKEIGEYELGSELVIDTPHRTAYDTDCVRSRPKADDVSYTEANLHKSTDDDNAVLRDIPSVRKKIIPPEHFPTPETLSPLVHLFPPVHSESQTILMENNPQHNALKRSHVHHNILSSTNIECNIGYDNEANDTEEPELSFERNSNCNNRKRHQGGAVDSSDASFFTPSISRPETPIWDFYDFAPDEGEKAGKSNELSPTALALETSTSAAGGTLQESIQHLGVVTTTLDTCTVIGPVLPAAMIEDFDLDSEEVLEMEDVVEEDNVLDES